MEKTYSYFKQLINYENIFKPEVHKELEYIYAHLSKSGEYEILIEHSQKTLHIFEKLLYELSLKPIIDDLIDNLYSEFDIHEASIEKIKFRVFVWKIIFNIIYHHDIGKINKEYQRIKLKNYKEFKYFNINFKDTNHSKYSMYFLSIMMLRELEDFKKEFTDKQEVFYKILYVCSILISIVDRHHSKLEDVVKLIKDRSDDMSGKDKNIMNIFKSITIINNIFNFKDYFYVTNDYVNRQRLKFKEEMSLFFLYKLLYSALVTSDYYATLCYMNNILPHEIKLNCITKEIANYLEINFYKNKLYNQKFKIIGNVKKLRAAEINYISDLNDIRSKILIEASDNLIEHLNNGDKRIFFLNVPTAGGKTNISMKLLIDMLTHHNVKNIKRAYYVFPFINIIEQNYNVLVETLTNKEVDEQELISKVYSYNEWDFDLKDEEELEYYINQQFLNNPINVISNVNFFNSFLKNGKKINYKLANLANSIIIIDEIQAFPNNMWEYFAKLISNISKKYNCYFILMSATLPDLSKFLKKEEKDEIIDLIKNPERYQTHQCFKRNIIELNLKKESLENKEFMDSFFVNRIRKEREKQKSKLKILCVVNTIKNSYILFDKLNEELKKDYDIFLLNSTILPSRRREIISTFNKKSEELNRDIILVSTQSVEAGVDIDCNFGFREISPIDSIEQISGRINREGKRKAEDSLLYIFDLGTAKYVYKKDARLKVQEKQTITELKDIISNKRFNDFYSKVIEYLKEIENEYAENYNRLLQPTYQIELKELAKNQYIEDDNITFFMPLKIDTKYLNLNENMLRYLRNLGITVKNNIDGIDVWNAYRKIITNFDNKNTFLEAKKLQSIINQFTFSLTNRRFKGDLSIVKSIQSFIDLGKFESIGGIVKVDEDFIRKTDYSIKFGLNMTKLQSFFDINNII